MEKTIIACLMAMCMALAVQAQHRVEGYVRSADDRLPLRGATVRSLGSKVLATTDEQGFFQLSIPFQGDSIRVSYMGYVTRLVPVLIDPNSKLEIFLVPDGSALEEVVVNTGYYQVPAERATGAFTHIDSKLLNRSVAPSIIDRLEGVTNSLLFDRRNIEGENIGSAPELRVRGLGTIEANSSPLVVVDNFPYEGDINTINPNDIESVTVLRDAASASIWGARAGNGVIVINTKQGRYNQAPMISFNGNVLVGNKPDLFYNRNFLPPETVLAIQEELFARRAYQERNQTTLPLYIELLVKQRDGLVSDGEFEAIKGIYAQTDIREEALQHLYRRSVSQQYALSASGGSAHYRYYIAAGYDAAQAMLVGNGSTRRNLSVQNTFSPKPNLEINGSIWYSTRSQTNNGIALSGLQSGFNAYAPLVDQNGRPLPLPQTNIRLAYQEEAQANGLLDWLYRPVEERDLASNGNDGREIRMNVGVRYGFLKHFSFMANYQFIRSDGESRSYYDPESYFVRHLVNRFTSSDGTRVIPHGGILDVANMGYTETHASRVQGNYSQALTHAQQIAVLAGMEFRQGVTANRPPSRVYNYSEEYHGGNATLNYQTRHPTRPVGSAVIPFLNWLSSQANSRDISYFGNMSYALHDKYILSGSARWDGSNLIGVKANQRGTTLWSVGGSWDMGKEDFYPFGEWLPYSRLRMTYGSAGLIDKTQSAYPVISIATDAYTGLPYGILTHPGNPALRWEKVNTLNLALDWASKNRRVSGSAEIYQKAASDLLTDKVMDPTAGVSGVYKTNYANLRTRGVDIQINTTTLNGPLFWRKTLLVNYARNKVTDVKGPSQQEVSMYVSGRIPVRNESMDQVYSVPWNGLSPVTGQPLIYMQGEVSDDYQTYYHNLSLEDLARSGVSVPPWFGSLMNAFEWRNLELSFLVTFKAGHVFRRTSMFPGEEYLLNANRFHADYFDRWARPGDERTTHVPAYSETINEHRNWVYRDAEVLVTPGDAIRLQDVSLSYSLPDKIASKLALRQVKCYSYFRNLGILWRANRQGLDPDYPNADFPAPFTMAFGLQLAW